MTVEPKTTTVAITQVPIEALDRLRQEAISLGAGDADATALRLAIMRDYRRLIAGDASEPLRATQSADPTLTLCGCATHGGGERCNGGRPSARSASSTISAAGESLDVSTPPAPSSPSPLGRGVDVTA